MLCQLENKRGLITVDSAVLAHITVEAVRLQNGNVFLSTSRGRIISPSDTGSNEIRHIEVSDGEKSSTIDLKFYIVIKFGTSISAVAKQLMSSIRRDAANLLGISVDNITIIITGVKSRKLVKRNLQING